MGLGPPVCRKCKLLAEYHPNKKDPTKQGDWPCPQCGWECDDHLFGHSQAEEAMIIIATKVFRENKGHEFPDK
jgi:hypothetical protein